MSGQDVFQPEFLFLELMEDDVVGVRPMLLAVDLGLERGVLGCDCLDLSFVHRSIFFRWLTRDSLVNKPRNARFVFIDPLRFGWPLARLADDSGQGDDHPRFG